MNHASETGSKSAATRLLIAAAAVATGILIGSATNTVCNPTQEAPKEEVRIEPSTTPVPNSDTITWPPQLRNPNTKQLMLRLINQERIRRGISPLYMGSNPAPQVHADTSLETCTGSHWSADGLKPYARYSLAGGYQHNAENWSTTGPCPTGTALENHPETLVQIAFEGFMESPSHKANILSPQFRKLSIGIAWNSHNFNAVQHFESLHSHLTKLPTIDEENILTFAGSTIGLPPVTDKRELSLVITHDPPPETLTPRQTAATYCYRLGNPVARIRARAKPGWTYTDSHWTFSRTVRHCPDPRFQPPIPHSYMSPAQETRLFQKAKRQSATHYEAKFTIPYVTAQTWLVFGYRFKIEADLSETVKTNGPGIYTAILSINVEGKKKTIMQYSIFHEIPEPAGYAAK